MDGFGSHLTMFKLIFEYNEINSMIEFGMGDFSTPYFIENVKDKVTSIEMQQKPWYDKIHEQFSRNKKWTGINCIGRFDFMKLKIYEKVDLAFVDGHGDSRPECINFISKFTSNIVVHDTETISYRWHLVNLPEVFIRVDDVTHRPWTTLYTTNRELAKYVKERI